MQIHTDVIHTEILGKHFLVPVCELAALHSGLFMLNEMGMIILEMLQNHQDPEEIKEKLLAEYDVEEKVLAADLYEYLQTLRQYGLLMD